MERQENRRILIVDDEQDIHGSMRSVLVDSQSKSDPDLAELEEAVFSQSEPSKTPVAHIAPYIIDSAYQGEDALKMVKAAIEAKSPYALAFMDMRMPPGWDGLRTIQEIWKVAPKTEIVIVSAYSDHSWNDFVKLFGSTDQLFILKKPFHSIELQQIANALTSKWNLSHQLESYLSNLEEISQERAKKIVEQQGKIIQSEKLASLGKMAGGIAHEINSPLAIILMTAENMREINMKEQSAKVHDRDQFDKKIQTIINTTIRIGKITNGLTLFSRDARVDPVKNVEFGAIIEDTLIFCEQRFKDQGVILKYNRPPASLMIECRATQLSQVLLNLLNNAYDAIEKLKEKWIEILVKDLGESIELRVTDSGPGIPKQAVDKIFDPFFTTKEVGKGTGLGLSISKGLIDGHEGELFVDVESPHTCFVIRLPKKQPQKRAQS